MFAGFLASAAFHPAMSQAQTDNPPRAPKFAAVAHRFATHEGLRIVAFGSSSTEGVGASTPANSYPARLQADLAAALPGNEITVINRGIGGQDAVEFHARLAGIIADKPDLVIFQTGTNDPLRELPLDQFIALTRGDIQTLRAAGIDVMLMEPQFCRIFADKPGSFAYVEAVRDLGAEFGIPVIRRWDLMKEWLARHVARPEQLQAPDGLHMADRGYALLARVVTRVILADGRAPRLMASGE